MLPQTGLATQGVPPPAWNAVLFPHSTFPDYLFAVDKSRQEVVLTKKDSTRNPVARFMGTTGRVPGDKMKEGDLKTPEGVYFVIRRIISGLDFAKYGKEAYTLNYPNPVDRLREKTGYGIWVHGRGEPLVPLQTEGCVAMRNEELTALGDILSPGAPVLMAQSLAFNQQKKAEYVVTAELLQNKVKAWSRARSDRSPAFFDFYAPDAYGLAQEEPFAVFRAQKEREFQKNPEDSVAVSHIRVLPGPGYWVTWFQEEGGENGGAADGVRRLYWSGNNEGDYVIVGMEWLPGSRISIPPDPFPLSPQTDVGPSWTEPFSEDSSG